MPLMTDKLHRMQEIHKMDLPLEERVRLMEAIRFDPKEFGCHHCRGRRDAAERLLRNMVNAEIAAMRLEANK